MNRFNIAVLLLLIALFALPFAVHAQDDSLSASTEIALAGITIPPMLATLVILNNRATEFVKLWLSAPSLPINLDKETQRVVVITSSAVVGLALALFLPDANSWLPENFQDNRIAAVLLSTVASSFGGALAQYVLMILSGVAEWFKTAKAVYTTTTSVSTPASDTPLSVAKDTLAVAAQVAGEAKG